MNSNTLIRSVSPEDAEALLKIYAPYVTDTAVTFEYDVPSLAEFRSRIIGIMQKRPYIAAVRGGNIVGYAYAGEFHSRAAYSRSAELSVYVAMDERRSGIGRILYTQLEDELRRLRYLNLYACIAYTDTEDEYLTQDSVRFHEHMGYNIVGHFHKCGCKFGRWYDMVYMEKLIGEHYNEQNKAEKAYR